MSSPTALEPSDNGIGTIGNGFVGAANAVANGAGAIGNEFTNGTGTIGNSSTNGTGTIGNSSTNGAGTIGNEFTNCAGSVTNFFAEVINPVSCKTYCPCDTGSTYGSASSHGAHASYCGGLSTDGRQP
ncbi:MAG: hypothetical protein IJR28_04110 [Ottowia sp.]|nr:hypothetical protein [Ottowia sp.]